MVDDPFTLLGLPRRFDLEAAQIQAAWLRRAAALHPDRFLDPIESAEAAQQAARINDARAILASEEARANALLRLLGGPTKEQDKSLPEGFLIDVLDVRQEMETALARNDAAVRVRLESWARTERQTYLDAVAELFAQGGERPDDATLREIRRQLNALRYIERMIEQLREA